MPIEGVAGIAGAIGYSAETTYGTTVAPSKGMEFLPGETLQRTQNFAFSQGLKSGRIVQPGFRGIATTRMAAGNLPIEVPNQGLGAFLNLLVGETVTPSAAVEGQFTYKFKIGATDPFKKSMTLVVGRPKTVGGTVESFCYAGTVMNTAEFSIVNGGMLNAQFGLEAQDELVTGDTGFQSISALNIPSSKLESFPSTTAKLEISGAEAKAIREVKVNISRPTENNRYYLGSTTRQQPFTNGMMTVMVNAVADFEGMTLYNFFKKVETPTGKLTFQGGLTEAGKTKKFELIFEFPFLRFEGDSPNIKDMGVLQQTIPMKAEESSAGAAPCTIEYMTTDSAL